MSHRHCPFGEPTEGTMSIHCIYICFMPVSGFFETHPAATNVGQTLAALTHSRRCQAPQHAKHHRNVPNYSNHSRPSESIAAVCAAAARVTDHTSKCAACSSAISDHSQSHDMHRSMFWSLAGPANDMHTHTIVVLLCVLITSGATR
jgi:hypothetical protein